MPPAFTLSQDQTLKFIRTNPRLIAQDRPSEVYPNPNLARSSPAQPKTAKPSQPAPPTKAKTPARTPAAHPTPSQSQNPSQKPIPARPTLPQVKPNQTSLLPENPMQFSMNVAQAVGPGDHQFWMEAIWRSFDRLSSHSPVNQEPSAVQHHQTAAWRGLYGGEREASNPYFNRPRFRCPPLPGFSYRRGCRCRESPCPIC